MERVAAVAWNDVHPDPARAHFRRQRARLDAELLDHAVVRVEAVGPTVVVVGVDGHAVHLVRDVVGIRAVHLDVDRLHAFRAADIRTVGRHTGDERRLREHVAARRNRVEHLAIHHRLLRDVLHVYERRLACDGDGLF
jgi:hypothetical protein